MECIEKALQDLAEAVKTMDTIARVTVSITLVKPKPDKAAEKPDKRQ